VTRANRAYELRVTRDTVEVVEIASGEVVLFWDTPPDRTRRIARALRADLSQLEPEPFLETWRAFTP
jgi:hypothetical protein